MRFDLTFLGVPFSLRGSLFTHAGLHPADWLPGEKRSRCISSLPVDIRETWPQVCTPEPLCSSLCCLQKTVQAAWLGDQDASPPTQVQIWSRLTCLSSTPMTPLHSRLLRLHFPTSCICFRHPVHLERRALTSAWHLLLLPLISPARTSSSCITIPLAQSWSLAGSQCPVPLGPLVNMTEARNFLCPVIVICILSSSRGALEAVAAFYRLCLPASASGPGVEPQAVPTCSPFPAFQMHPCFSPTLTSTMLTPSWQTQCSASTPTKKNIRCSWTSTR